MLQVYRWAQEPDFSISLGHNEPFSIHKAKKGGEWNDMRGIDMS